MWWDPPTYVTPDKARWGLLVSAVLGYGFLLDWWWLGACLLL